MENLLALSRYRDIIFHCHCLTRFFSRVLWKLLNFILASDKWAAESHIFLKYFATLPFDRLDIIGVCWEAALTIKIDMNWSISSLIGQMNAFIWIWDFFFYIIFVSNSAHDKIWSLAPCSAPQMKQTQILCIFSVYPGKINGIKLLLLIFITNNINSICFLNRLFFLFFFFSTF